MALINTEGEPWQLWRQQASQSQVPRGARAGICRECLTEEAMCRNKMTGGWSDPAAACQHEFSWEETWRRGWKWQRALNDTSLSQCWCGHTKWKKEVALTTSVRRTWKVLLKGLNKLSFLKLPGCWILQISALHLYLFSNIFQSLS